MSRLPRRLQLLVIVVAVQVVLLVATAVLHGARIADGTVVRVAVRPLDPIDPALGAYSELRYPFQDLAVPAGDGHAFVLLERPGNADGLWRATRVTADEGDLDDADAWIRLTRTGGELDVDAIGSFYASAERSRELDRQLADSGGVARLSLADDGSPTLLDVSGG